MKSGEEGEEAREAKKGEKEGEDKRRRNLIDERIVFSRLARVFRAVRKNPRNFSLVCTFFFFSLSVD